MVSIRAIKKTWLGPAAEVHNVLDAVVFADLELPGVAWCLTSGLRRVLHGYYLGRTIAHR